MPAKQEPEVKVSTSLKNLGGFVKVLAYALGSLGIGAAGSVLTASSNATAMEEKIKALEESSQSYNVRISTTETRVGSIESNYADIKKDLADIRSTNTQILLVLQKDKDR